MTFIDEAVATIRAFQTKAQATRVVLLLNTEDGATTMLVADEHGVAITEHDETAYVTATTAAPRPLPEIRPAPPSAIHIDTTSGQLSAPIGTIDHLAQSTLALARAFGGLTVATAEFATHSVPITFAAREGEPIILQAGDEQFELD